MKNNADVISISDVRLPSIVLSCGTTHLLSSIFIAPTYNLSRMRTKIRDGWKIHITSDARCKVDRRNAEKEGLEIIFDEIHESSHVNESWHAEHVSSL